ncbi:MAG TPA: hypothetical protein DEQ73_02940 [Phycisphaerales bacterium]|nr:hypothetical protein [Rhodospirillaceae bacterium]RPG10582.1 MAG: hypothetical protein CBB84_000485 [Phycisphaera sp. TMED24]HCD29537.1 hypothetical protein [Phycisphaerales bacterium]
MQTIKKTIWFAVICVGALLLIGQYITDRFSTIQLVHWVPTILIPLLGVLCVTLGNTRQLRATSITFCVIAVGHWVIHDWKPKSPIDFQQQPFVFTHWTVEEIDEDRARSTIEVASQFETDFLCLVNINTVLRLPWKEQLKHLPYQEARWPFLFASKWPLKCELVLSENHTVAHPLNIARGSIEHPDGIIEFVALDCPSDPSLSRMGTSHRIRQALGPCTADLVFGDFNCPRHAASIQQAFPDHTHAFDHAGNGPIVTWPTRFPILHLDHLLLSDRWTCVKYGTYRPEVGDHLPQHARLIRSTP